MKLFHTTILLLLALLLAFPLAAFAQSEGEVPPVTYVIPPVLLALMAMNNRTTEALKLYLASDKLPFTPPASVRSLIVLVFSALFGMASAFLAPNALDWLGAGFNPYAAVIVTGFVVSLGAGTAQMVLGLLASLGNKSVYSTTTTISAPPADTPTSTANKALEVASQAAQG